MKIRTALAGCGLLVLLVAAIYGRTAGHDFTNYDDKAYITENRMVAAGLTAEGVRWAFTAFHAGNWHPVTWLSHMLDTSLFGPGRAGGPHLVSAGLHAANACLLFLLLAAMTGAPGRSLAVAGLFAVHPLHVEAVAWAAERKELLAALFMTAALGAWLRHLSRRGWLPWIAAVLLYALALMSKPMPVTFPFLLLLLDWWPLGRVPGGPGPAAGGAAHAPATIRRLLVEKWPFALLAAASVAVTVQAQQAGGAVTSLTRLAFGDRAANAIVSYVRYLAEAAWPSGLGVFYPHPLRIPWPTVAGAALLVAVATAAAVVAGRRLPWLAVGWFWYLGTLVPVIGLVQVGLQSHADRYTYVPLTGIFIAAVWGAAALLPNRAFRWAAAACVVVPLAVAAFVQAGYWRDGTSIFDHTARATRGNWLAWVNLGGAHADAKRYPEAASALERALEIKPSYSPGWVALGWVRTQLGDGPGAREAYGRSIQRDSGDAEGNIHVGRMLSQVGEHEKAIVAYARALRYAPGSAEARIGLSASHNNFGNQLMRAGRAAEAVPHYREAVRLDPADVNVRGNLERAMREAGVRE